MEFAEVSDKAKNVAELVEALGVNRQSYYNWRKMEGAPKPRSNIHDIAAWKKFIADFNLNSHSLATAGDLQREKLAKQNELLQIDIDKKRGELITREEVRSEVTRMIAQFKSVLYTKLEAEAPPVFEGLTAAEIQIKQRAFIAEAFEQLSADKWTA